MKKIFIIFSICAASLSAHSQNARIDASGNYVAVHKQDTTGTGTPTHKTFTDTKGNTFPVFVTKNGKLYYMRVSSKTGKQYKQYLKLEN